MSLSLQTALLHLSLGTALLWTTATAAAPPDPANPPAPEAFSDAAGRFNHAIDASGTWAPPRPRSPSCRQVRRAT